jgi:hypothetical protein
LAAVALALAGACQLDRGVLYACDDAEPRCQPGATCGKDGYCHWDDAGARAGCGPGEPGFPCRGAGVGGAVMLASAQGLLVSGSSTFAAAPGEGGDGGTPLRLETR